MRAIFESIFDVIYLVGVITTGFIMLKQSERGTTRRQFGMMALVLGIGDSFHLIPRIIALLTVGTENFVFYLGIGKFITSITMTIFYLILYFIWKEYYGKKETKSLDITMWILTILRIGLCLLPQNGWLLSNPPMTYAIARNIPFAIMGGLQIYLFAKENKADERQVFKHMSTAIFLSFLFYAPVVLFADVNPLIGLLMIPKTLAYVWVVIMGYQLPKNK